MVRIGALLLSPLCLDVAASHEHGALVGLFPDPAAFGFEPVPLNLSYDHVKLSVTGAVPDYLNGTLYRGAPGAWPDGMWLDGLITLNAFAFSKGEVTYSMRWNQDHAYNHSAKGTPLPQPLPDPEKPGQIPQRSNSSWPTGVAFRQVQGQILGSTGVSNANSFDGDTLAPLELPFVYDDELGAPYLAPTHEMTMPDGTVLHHLISGIQKTSGGNPAYLVTSIKPGTRTREVLAKIEQPKEVSSSGLPSFQHMPLATEDYYIMLEANCYYPDTVTEIGEVDWKGWKSDLFGAKAHVRLVSRATGESLLFPLSHNIFAIHHINAYHDKATNSVVMDTIQLFPSMLPCSTAFSGTSVKAMSSITTGIGYGMSKPIRLVFPLDKPGATVTPMAIGSVSGVEFPTIRYDDLNGQPYRFGYFNWISKATSGYYDSLLKLDVNTGNYSYWHEAGHYPGEPIFVPNPAGTAEDDGVVMTNVLDTTRKETYLLLLDAQTMKEIARAGPTPHAIPHGYHGRYFNRKLNAATVGHSVFV